jgi:hypothetical protein
MKKAGEYIDDEITALFFMKERQQSVKKKRKMSGIVREKLKVTMYVLVGKPATAYLHPITLETRTGT